MAVTAVSNEAALAIAAAIGKLIASNEKQYLIMNAYLTNNWSPLGGKTPGTPITILNLQAAAINDMVKLQTEMIDQQKKLTASVQVLQSSLASVSANIASGVTTQQLAVADQIKNNKFQQLTTNAALERAELPKTVVLPTELVESIKGAVQDTLVVKAQTKASALVEEQLTSAVSWTTTTASNIVANSFIGTAATNAWGTLKGWLNISEPPLKQTVADQKADARLPGLLDPVPLPPDP